MIVNAQTAAHVPKKDVPSKSLEHNVTRSLFAWSMRKIDGHRCQRLQPLLLHDHKTARDRTCESTFMDSSTHDKVEGRTKEAVGKVKEKTGKAIGNQDLQDRGTAEKVGGKVECKVGDVKKVFGK